MPCLGDFTLAKALASLTLHDPDSSVAVAAACACMSAKGPSFDALTTIGRPFQAHAGVPGAKSCTPLELFW